MKPNLPPYEVLYHQLLSLKPDHLDEFTLVIKLAQALNCHGYNEQASRLAYVLGQKIILTYPERVAAGELNFREITEKAKAICETFTRSTDNERITFELAILGLTVPRFPAGTSLEEVCLLDTFFLISPVIAESETKGTFCLAVTSLSTGDF